MENKDYYPEEDESHLLEYWQVIIKRKKTILIVVLVAVLLTAIVSLFMRNIYQSKALIAPIMVKDTGGGAMALLAQQMGGLASLGITMPTTASAAEIVNLLKSNVLREKIITKYNLLPVLFDEDWDKEKKKWKTEDTSGFTPNPFKLAGKLVELVNPPSPQETSKKKAGIPDVWDGLRKFKDIVSVSQNLKENSITISVDFPDPETARQIVEYFLLTLTDHMSSETKRVAVTNRKYLESQLNETSDPLIKQKIYNLIAQQIETSMMAEVKENFAFKIIDPPMTPDKKIKPKRTMMVIVAFMMALFIGVFMAIFLEHLGKAKTKQES